MADIIDLFTGKGGDPMNLSFKNREHYKNKFSGTHFNNKFVQGIKMDGEVYKGTKLFKEIENMYGKRGFAKTSERQFMDDLEKRGVEDKMRKRLVQEMRSVAMKDKIVDYQNKTQQKLAKRAATQAKAGRESQTISRRNISILSDENTEKMKKEMRVEERRVKAEGGSGISYEDQLGIKDPTLGEDYIVTAKGNHNGKPKDNVISIHQNKKLNDLVTGGLNHGQKIKPLTGLPSKGGGRLNLGSSDAPPIKKVA